MILTEIENTEKQSYLKLGVGKNKRHVLMSDILYCKADINYTHIFINDNTKIVTSKTLKVYDELLSSTTFFRIHASYIVNTKEIINLQKNHLILTLKNGIQLPLSHRKKAGFKSMLKKITLNIH